MKVENKLYSVEIQSQSKFEVYIHSIHPPLHFPLSAGWVEPPTKFSKIGGGGGRGGLTGLQLLEGVAGKDWVTCFREHCNFHLKNKLKSEIFNDKKSV